MAGKTCGRGGSTKPELSFAYGADGQRISKTVGDPMNGGFREWYLRDAQGNIMATYRYTNTTGAGPSLKVTERPVYGSSRIGSYTRQMELYHEPTVHAWPYLQPMQAPLKRYELTDHLGNVAAVVTGRLLPGNNTGSPYQAELVSAQTQEAYGALLPNRHWNSSAYAWGLNGQLKDDEVYGPTGTSTTAEFWQYDTRVVRRWNLDPVDQVSISNYAAFGLNPVINVDPNGAWFWESKNVRQARHFARTTGGKFEKRRNMFTGKNDASVTFGYGTREGINVNSYAFRHGQDRSDLLESADLALGGDSHDRMQANTTGLESLGWWLKGVDDAVKPGHAPPAALQAFISLNPVVAAGNVYSGVASGTDVWDQEQSGWGTALNGVSIIPFLKFAEAANAIRGVGLSDDVARTFQYGSYTRTTLTESMKGFRYYDNMNAFAKGRFLTPSVSSFTFMDRIGLGIRPSWNSMTKVATWELPAGTTVFQGKAAMQFPWIGGKTQFFVPSLNGAKRLMQ